MKVVAVRTEEVSVEVDPLTALKALRAMLLPPPAERAGIVRRGGVPYWETWSDCYHNPKPVKLRDLTAEEAAINSALEVLSEAVKFEAMSEAVGWKGESGG